MPELVPISEALEGVSPKPHRDLIYRAIREKRITGVKVRGQWRISAEDLARAMAEDGEEYIADGLTVLARRLSGIRRTAWAPVAKFCTTAAVSQFLRLAENHKRRTQNDRATA